MKIPRNAAAKHKERKEPYDPRKHGVSQTALNLWLDCREKARLRYIAGVKPDMKTAWEQGASLHSILESLYKAIMAKKITNPTEVASFTEKEVDLIEEKLQSEGKHQALEAAQPMLDVATALFPQYFVHYSKDFNQSWEGIEELFEFEIIPGVRFKGAYDGKFRKKGLWVFETKFKSFWPENYSDLLQLDLQVAAYTTSITRSGEKLGGCRYNIVRKPQLRRKKEEGRAEFLRRVSKDIAERPDHYFERHDVEFGKAEIEHNGKRLVHLVMEFVRWCDASSQKPEDMDLLYNSNHCDNKWGACEYLRACSQKDYTSLSK